MKTKFSQFINGLFLRLAIAKKPRKTIESLELGVAVHILLVYKNVKNKDFSHSDEVTAKKYSLQNFIENKLLSQIIEVKDRKNFRFLSFLGMYQYRTKYS